MAYVGPNVKSFEIYLNPECCEDVWKSEWSNTMDNCVQSYVYKPGGQVEGTIQIVVLQPLNFSGVYINVHGLMYVGFSEDDTSTPDVPARHQREKGEKEFVAQKDYVIQPSKQIFGGTQGQPQVLPPGDHQFPFKFDIPGNIPSSFVGGYGYIDYWIDAFIDQSPFGVGMTSRKNIIVHGFYDLSTEPTALIPFEQSKEETYCCWCCENGNFSYSMVLPKKGYSSGERIKPSIVLRNYTPSRAEVKLKLVKKVIYEAANRTRSEAKETISESYTSIDPSTTEQWEAELLVAESSPPSKFFQCPNIKVEYKLQFEFSPGGCNCDVITEDVDLLVGHMPSSLPAQSLPVMTEPQTYVYPSVDLSGPQVTHPEFQPLLPPPYQKDGIPVTAGYHPSAEPSAPPITHQPYPQAGPAFGGDRSEPPPPPSYSECIGMTDLSGAPGPSYQMASGSSYPMPERYRPYIAPGGNPQEEEKMRDLP